MTNARTVLLAAVSLVVAVGSGCSKETPPASPAAPAAGPGGAAKTPGGPAESGGAKKPFEVKD